MHADLVNVGMCRMENDPRLEEISGFYASRMAAAAQSSDPRLERVFKLVPRQAFFPPGPWKIGAGPGPGGTQRYLTTPSADPIYLYVNGLVALDAEKSINNGEPYLHAHWIGAVAPQPGETVVHIGAGTGYYTAILSVLVLPGGSVTGFEIHPELAAAARVNLKAFENAKVLAADAVTTALPPTDLIYVNAGVIAPPVSWLDALKPGGRIIFPWRPTDQIGVTVIISRAAGGLAVKPVSPSWFIPCVGASEAQAGSTAPTHASAWATRSAHRTRDRAPDETATAIYKDLWFSSEPLATADQTAVAK